MSQGKRETTNKISFSFSHWHKSRDGGRSIYDRERAGVCVCVEKREGERERVC